MATVELRFSALPEHVRTARLVAAAVARRAGVDEAVLDEVRLAVGEACTRAVGLHQSSGIEAPVRVLLIEEEKKFSIEVGDEAPGSVPGEAASDAASGGPDAEAERGRDGPRGHQRPRRRRRGHRRRARRTDPDELAHHAAGRGSHLTTASLLLLRRALLGGALRHVGASRAPAARPPPCSRGACHRAPPRRLPAVASTPHVPGHAATRPSGPRPVPGSPPVRPARRLSALPPCPLPVPAFVCLASVRPRRSLTAPHPSAPRRPYAPLRPSAAGSRLRGESRRADADTDADT